MIKKILAIMLSFSLLVISLGVPQTKAVSELPPTISEAISGLPCNEDIQGMISDLVERYSEVRGGIKDEKVICEAVSSGGELISRISPLMTPDQLKTLVGWFTAPTTISSEALADIDEISLAKVFKVFAEIMPRITSRVGGDKLVEVALGFPAGAVDDFIFMYTPRGNFDEYIKGAPRKYCWLALLGPFTGPRGGFMADVSPLLGIIDIYLTTAPSFKGVGNLSLYLADTRGDAATLIASFEHWAAIPHKTPMLFCFDPNTAILPLKEKGAIALYPGGAGRVDGHYLNENIWSTSCLVEEGVCDKLRYMVMEYPRETEKPQPKKIGFIGMGGDVSSRSQEMTGKWIVSSDFFKLLQNEYDIENVGFYTLTSTATDCTPQLIRLRDAGAEWIFTAITETSTSACVAKCARSLKLKNIQFVANSYGLEHSVIDISGPKAVEGWMTDFNGISLDDPNLNKREKAGKRMAEFLSDLVGAKLPPATIGMQETMTTGITFIKLATTALDRVGGWSNIDDITSEMMKEEFFKLCGKGEPYWDPLTSMHPITLLPGKTTPQWDMLMDCHDGKLYEHTRRGGEHWVWVPPKVVPGPGPCPPNGWVAPPLEGSIDYGDPWGEWDFEKFVKTYDPPLWWALLEWGAPRSDNTMHKDLFFKTLDKYFEAKGMDGAQRKELIQENLEMYKFPQKWVGWFNEYLGQAPLGPCLPCG